MSKTYQVQFNEYVLYRTEVTAANPPAAIEAVQSILANEGPERFRIIDNGSEGFEVRRRRRLGQ